MATPKHPLPRNFGGIRFPDQFEPPPGPLSVLAGELAREQKPGQGEPATPAVRRMLSDLPARVRTQALQKRYMRVLEQLARQWDSPRDLRRLFDELIFESRQGNRAGLSFDAIVELTELNDYVKRVKFRERPSVWDQALGLF